MEYNSGMSATEIINELPKLTESERRAVFGRLLELEDLPLSEADEALVESRLANAGNGTDCICMCRLSSAGRRRLRFGCRC